jgi:hypothetical protein
MDVTGFWTVAGGRTAFRSASDRLLGVQGILADEGCIPAAFGKRAAFGTIGSWGLTAAVGGWELTVAEAVGTGELTTAVGCWETTAAVLAGP